MKDRYLRQQDIVPPDRLARCHATVVGVGAIGRQVAIQLTAMGIAWLKLIDPDTVEPVNLAPQGYWENDVDQPKVHATGNICHEINPQLELYAEVARFRRSLLSEHNTQGSEEASGYQKVFFCCVDSIETRRLIWQSIKDQVDLFCDGRMTAEVVRVLTVADIASREHYPSTLFGADEAYAGSCTAKSTIFTANIAAGLMLEQFSRWLRQLPVDPDIQLNLLTSELHIQSVA